MIFNFIFSCGVIAGIALLWRNFRYDTDNPANTYINQLNYWLQKPITCGLCFTFWTALIFDIFFDPLQGWLPSMRFALGAWEPFFAFCSAWMVLGTGATFAVYVIDTFFQVSHYYKHQTHHD
jgi:hypothetical protein